MDTPVGEPSSYDSFDTLCGLVFSWPRRPERKSASSGAVVTKRRSDQLHRHRQAGIQSTGGEHCQLRRYLLDFGYSPTHFQL